jgi:hypothetical protein
MSCPHERHCKEKGGNGFERKQIYYQGQATGQGAGSFRGDDKATEGHRHQKRQQTSQVFEEQERQKDTATNQKFPPITNMEGSGW